MDDIVLSTRQQASLLSVLEIVIRLLPRGAMRKELWQLYRALNEAYKKGGIHAVRFPSLRNPKDKKKKTVRTLLKNNKQKNGLLPGKEKTRTFL